MYLRVPEFPILLIYFTGLALVAGVTDVWVELRAPRFVLHRDSAVLRCEHNVDPEAIDKVVFYKNGQRIMKFVRGRDPPYEIYNFTGVEINVIKLYPTSITLDRVDFSATGPYACEIALETPLYSKVSKVHELTVYVPQKTRPRIKLKHKKLSPTDYLEATCTSAQAHPAPHLTWFINDKKVDEKMIIPHGTMKGRHHHHGMPVYVTSSSLEFPLSSLQLSNQTLKITCLSTIPSYAIEAESFADVQNNTIPVNVVRIEPAPTQLPVKIVSPDTSLSCRHIPQYLYVVVVALLLVCHFSF